MTEISKIGSWGKPQIPNGISAHQTVQKSSLRPLVAKITSDGIVNFNVLAFLYKQKLKQFHQLGLDQIKWNGMNKNIASWLVQADYYIVALSPVMSNLYRDKWQTTCKQKPQAWCDPNTTCTSIINKYTLYNNIWVFDTDLHWASESQTYVCCGKGPITSGFLCWVRQVYHLNSQVVIEKVDSGPSRLALCPASAHCTYMPWTQVSVLSVLPIGKYMQTHRWLAMPVDRSPTRRCESWS